MKNDVSRMTCSTDVGPTNEDFGRTVNTGYVIVTPTYSGIAKYYSEAMPLLDVFWPGHPPVIVFSDSNNLMTSDVIIKPSTNWLEILLNGLLSVRKTRPEIAICVPVT